MADSRPGAPTGAQRFIAKLTVTAKPEFLESIGELTQNLARKHGLDAQTCGHLAVMVDEACTNVIQHAFEPGEEGTVDVVFLRRPGAFVVRVEDQGLPFDIAAVESGRGTGLGLRLMRAFADEVGFANLGRGKRVEMAVKLPYRTVDAFLTQEDRDRAAAATVPSQQPVQLRFLKETETVALSRCVWRSYGYSYISEYIYHPERVSEMIAGGLIESCVATTAGGELVGHLALIKERPDSTVGETGQAVVAPPFRGRKLFERMKAFLVDHARKSGMYGVYSESVTIHPFTQKGNLSLGAAETGILLGYVPESLTFRKIHEERQEVRQSTLLFYLRINEEPRREVFPPFHHGSMIRAIYEHTGLKRIVRPPLPPADLPGIAVNACLDVKVRPEWGHATLRVVAYGDDLVGQVEVRLKELCLARIDCIYLDLPLSAPHTAFLCARFEGLGFSFAGVIPELFDGDVLRLQFLNNVAVMPEKIVVVSDFGRRIVDYTLSLTRFTRADTPSPHGATPRESG